MANRRSPRERGALTLTVEHASEAEEDHDALADLPRSVVAGAAGLLAALFTWLIAFVGGTGLWALDRTEGFSAVLGALTGAWIATHGGGLRVGGEVWSVVPLGFTAGCVLVLGFVARRAALAMSPDLEPDADPRRTVASAARVAGLIAVTYALPVIAVAAATSAPRLAGVVAHALGVGLIGAWCGVARPLRASMIDLLPAWARPVPVAIGLGWSVTFAGGLAAVGAALVANIDRVTALQDQMGLTGPTLVAAWVLQAGFWINIVLWAVAWCLGAGFRLGAQSIVSPAGTDLGFLPAVPVFGAVPLEGPQPEWMMAWLGVGVIAGGVAAWWVLWRRPWARADEAGIVGGLAGVLAGLAITATGAISGGDLGSGNLTGLGPRLRELLVLAPAILGLAGLTVGLVWGIMRTAPALRAKTESDAAEQEEAEQDEAEQDEAEQDEADEPTNPRIGPARRPDR